MLVIIQMFLMNHIVLMLLIIRMVGVQFEGVLVLVLSEVLREGWDVRFRGGLLRIVRTFVLAFFLDWYDVIYYKWASYEEIVL